MPHPHTHTPTEIFSFGANVSGQPSRAIVTLKHSPKTNSSHLARTHRHTKTIDVQYPHTHKQTIISLGANKISCHLARTHKCGMLSYIQSYRHTIPSYSQKNYDLTWRELIRATRSCNRYGTPSYTLTHARRNLFIWREFIRTTKSCDRFPTPSLSRASTHTYTKIVLFGASSSGQLVWVRDTHICTYIHTHADVYSCGTNSFGQLNEGHRALSRTHQCTHAQKSCHLARVHPGN